VSFVRKLRFIVSRGKLALAMKLARISVKRMITGSNPPFRQIELQTTYACNLRCVHCSAASFSQVKAPLSIADYADIARQCREHRIPMVSFTGGEPLCDPRLDEIISQFDTGSTLLSVTTNGTLLTEQRIRKLKALGVDAFVISLDGPTPEINDPIRGEGVYSKVIHAVEAARSLGVFVMLIHALSANSMRNGVFDGLIDLAMRLDVPLHVSLAAPVGNWADSTAENHLLSSLDVKLLTERQKRHPFLRRDLDGNYSGRGCPAGTERFVISPTGEVMGCTKIQATFGNIRERSMLALRDDMAQIEVFRTSPPLCLAAEDTVFLKTYLPRLYGRKDVPIPADEFFME